MTFVIRPAERSDIDRIESLIEQVKVGLTSLAIGRDKLEQKIASSLRSLAADVSEPAGEHYFFVLSDDDTEELIGMCAINAAVGLDEPYYSYRIGTVVHASKELDVHRVHPALYLSNDYTGCTELTSLFLGPGQRGKSLGTLLSKSRLLFMAEFPHRFADRVIAEIRGVSDEHGRAPFWDGLGQHFFAMDFPTADHLVGTGHKSFIAELMPKHPIYVVFLRKDAQEAIGKPHPNSRRAKEILEREGFRYRQYIDIFDGGPTLECRLEDIATVRMSQRRVAQVASIEAEHTRCLISNTRVEDFRCCVAGAVLTGSEHVVIDPQTARAVRVAEGDPARVLEL